MAKAKDLYSNKGFGQVVESAANTLTFSEIRTNVSIFEKVAWIIQRIEWYVEPAMFALLVASADKFDMALTASEALDELSLNAPAVIDLYTQLCLISTQVGFTLPQMPLIRDFSNLPGGGLIVAPRPLFVAVKGTSLGSAVTVACRFYFTQKSLSAEEYMELIDFYRIVQ